MLPWTKKRNPPPPDLSIWKDCELIAQEIVAPIILENVREAQNWTRKANWHFGPYYLWGNVPALMPKFSWSHHRKKETRSSTAAAERAEIPFELALHIGRVFLPEREKAA